ncbi:DUF1653 domain-containing protein [bacterium]|nr:DUF1653 domain-containing protein [bacterium]NCQ55646.1 DUF1653 domain-containing protein [Candidatus Parcubacteria bacterium]NCS67471.1 DUF1653 domain-containing protein [Candidatus Peregrinibacteria bacterium]NCS96197.1 DUF1653 domain-containing protein [bacterium]
MLKRGKYLHYKGKEYEVLGVVLHTETREAMVHYQALYEIKNFDKNLYGEKITFVRPLKMWLEKVKVNGITLERFSFLQETNV